MIMLKRRINVLSVLILCQLSLGVQNQSKNILIINSINALSHESVLSQIASELKGRNYSVTIVRFLHSGDQYIKYDPSLHLIQLSLKNPYALPDDEYTDSEGRVSPKKSAVWTKKRCYWNIPINAYTIYRAHCHSLLGDRRFIDILKTENFSVALVDLLGNDCALALAKELRIPVAGYWGHIPSGYQANIVTGFISPSVKPYFMSEIESLARLKDRFWNFFLSMVDSVVVMICQELVYSYIQQHLPDSPHPVSLALDVNLILASGHEVLKYPGVTPDNVFYTGCFTCKLPQPLPTELDNWILSPGPKRLVVVSFGVSAFDSASVPQPFVSTLMEAFSLINYKVIMMFNSSHISSFIPHNVFVMDYIPQPDLLGSKYTAVFITHCGIKSIMESVYYKVPMVAIPVFADQGDNAERMRMKNIAVVLDKDTMTAQQLADAIVEAAENKIYKNSVEELSGIMREYHKESPMDRVVRLIEMVGEYRDLKHLKANTRNLYAFQHLFWDLLLFLAVLFVLGVYLMRKFLTIATRSWKIKVD